MHFRDTPTCPDRELTPPPVMDLYVETLTGTAFEVRVSPFETIMSVKSKIQRMEGVPVSQQHLIWQSKELEDENCLHDYRITDGATVKLVLAMRGGPINTRRIPIEDPTWREMMEYMEANREEIWEKLPGGRQVTLLVFRDGDQINFFRVIDRGDGTLSPLAETLSGSSMRVLNEETEDVAAQERVVENALTLQKMHALRLKMDELNLKKKPKKSRHTTHRSCSRTSSNHVVSVKPRIHNGGYSLNKHTRLPPVPEPSPPHSPSKATNFSSSAATADDNAGCSSSSSGALPKLVSTVLNSELPKTRTHPSLSYTALEAYRRSVVQSRVAGNRSELVDDEEEPVVGAAITAAVKPKAVVVPRINRTVSSAKRKVLYAGRRLDSLDPADLQQTLAKFDPRISVGRNSGGSRSRRGSDHLVGDIPSTLQLHPLEKVVELRPKTSPEKWDRTVSDVSLRSSPDSLSATAKDLCCDMLNRTAPRMRLRSQGSGVAATARTAIAAGSGNSSRDRERRRSHSIDPVDDAESDGTEFQASGGDCPRDLELVRSLISSPDESQNGVLTKYSLEDKGVAQRISLKTTQLLLRLSSNRSTHPSSSTQKLPPIVVPKKVAADPVAPRCQVCKKKTGLATSYTCRCGKNFCATHRYAETHECTFDYKSEGRRVLEQANPLVAAPKLPKI